MGSRRAIFRRIAAAYLTLAALAAVPAAQDLSAPLPLDPAIRAGILPNGLAWFVRRNGRPADRASLRLAVRAGSIDEDDDQRGLAHFLEHMAFNGSAHFAAGELVAYLESIGARFGPHVNAYTSYDETVYMLDVPTDRDGALDRGLLALADFAGGLTLDPEEIDRERGVVIEEWRGRQGAASRMQAVHSLAIYGGSKYVERLPIGTPEVLKTFEPRRLREFYEKWYRPDRMAVIVVGDIDPGRVERLIAAHFAALRRPADAADRPVHEIPAHDETRFGIATDPEAQASSVALLHKRPVDAERTVGDYRRALVRSLVHQMLNARFAELARQPDAAFVGASASGDRLGRTVDAFVLAARVAEGGIADGLAALAREAARVDRFGFGAAELERGRQRLLAAYERTYNEREKTEHAGLASERVRHFLEGEPVPGIAFEYDLARRFVPAVTAAEAAAAARELVTDTNRVVLATLPERGGAPAPTEAALREAMQRGAAAEVAAWVDDLEGRELMPARPRAGRVTATREVPSIGATVLTLSNGASVWLKPTDFKNDQIVITSYARGGTSLAGPETYHEAALSTTLVSLSGVGGLSPVDLDKLLPGRLVDVSPYISTYTHGVSGSSTPRDLETALQLLHLYFTAPNRAPETFALLKRRLAALLANQSQSPGAVFAERVREVNTMSHYTARPLRVGDVESLDVEAMWAYYDARFANAADFTFFVVGAFDVNAVVPLVETYVGSLPSTGAATASVRDLKLEFPQEVRRETVHKGREARSQTVVSFFADTGLDELEMHRLRAAASVLEQRLRDILREALGGTYSVSVAYSNTQPVAGYGTVAVEFGSSPENAERLVQVVLSETAKLRREGPSAAEIETAKEIERRELETALRQNPYWLNSMQTVHLLGWDPARIAARPERTASLTPANVHAAVQKYFAERRYTVVTLMPEK